MLHRVLSIAGSDSGGGAGIQADLKTFTVLGTYGMTAITAVTAQNTLGVHGIYPVPPEFVALQIRAIYEDIGAEAVKTGMLVNAPVVLAVAEELRRQKAQNLVVDPVMVAKGGEGLLEPGACDALRQALLPLALVVTPNVPEAEVLTGGRINSRDDMRQAAREIWEMGPAYVVLKGGHMEGDATDLVFDGTQFVELRGERISSTSTHGTGCTFSAALAAYLAKGREPIDAMKAAKEFVTHAIRHAGGIGKGCGPTNHIAWLRRASDAGEALKR